MSCTSFSYVLLRLNRRLQTESTAPLQNLFIYAMIKIRFNDASVASLITSEKSNIQIDFIDSTTDGSALENCYIPMGGAVKPYTKEGIINKEHFIYIKDNKIFEEEAKKSALYVKETLSKNNIEIDYYIPSYFNKESFDNFANNLWVIKIKYILKWKIQILL